jgi:hypothetical protein
MSFKTELLEIDPETGDLKPKNKKTLGQYLSRRTKAEVEEGGRVPGGDNTYPTGLPDEYTYTPPDANAYPVESDPNEKQQKFAKEYQMARWTFPTTLPLTRLAMNGTDTSEPPTSARRKNRGEILKDVITPDDLIPDPVDAIIMAQYGESPLPNINPQTVAMQAEIGIKLTKNRFTNATTPRSEPFKHWWPLNFATEGASSVIKETTPQTRRNLSTLVSRSKAYRGKVQQSTSHRIAAEQTPVLLTDSYQRALALYNRENVGSKSTETLKSKLNGIDGTIYKNKESISKQDVEELETRLESQYVPFYFHDLRTNEILNFHAFVSNVSDSYAANWTDTDGYGRMDPVQTYKNTTRSISLDFYVVSTSEKDFDRVWWTINRLVMMIYPQWSSGNELIGESGGKKFKFMQPFSQTITSSPLIRLRVGDLIASNYSRFNLARGFGLGLPTTFVDENTINASSAIEGVSDTLEAFISSLPEQIITIDSPIEPMLVFPEKGLQNIEVVFSSTITVKQGTGFIESLAGPNSTATILRGATGRVRDGKKKSDSTTIVVVELDIPIKVNNDNNPFARIKYVATNAEFLYSNNYDGLPVPILPNVATNAIEENFANEGSYLVGSNNSNSIVRSFEEVGGRGLAGSIRSLSFDWNEAPWETSAGSRAPIWCKVSIQFNPIHDLPMGLDSEGMPRAVPYPVGETVRQAYFPELNEKTKSARRQESSDMKNPLVETIAEKAEDEINKKLGRSYKRLF